MNELNEACLKINQALSEELKLEGETVFATCTKISYPVFLVNSINYFFRFGGMNLILDVINMDGMKIQEINGILSIIKSFRKYVSEEYKITFFTSIKEKLFEVF